MHCWSTEGLVYSDYVLQAMLFSGGKVVDKNQEPNRKPEVAGRLQLFNTTVKGNFI